MHNLTLVIPAKKEKESLSFVLDELKKYKVKILVILENNDIETINSIKNHKCKIIYQKNKGYGDALIQGINLVKTKYFCIFNADGSFNPNELDKMLKKIENEKFDLLFASRYEKNCSSDDDTIVTYLGNFFFTKLGNFFFNLNISDILYTFVLGKTHEVKNLNLKSKNFVFCVELPIKAKRYGLKISTTKSHERARIAGLKKSQSFSRWFF
jgi:glycosyltransferase involved in cell wall biosynthesis